MKQLALIQVVIAFSAGCAPMARVDLAACPESDAARTQLGTSLFKSDQEVMSNETIDQILSSTVALPGRSRIIVLNYGTQRWWHWYSEEVGRLDQAALEGFMGKVRGSDRIATAYVLPSMLAPEQQTIPHLRKAAARCQADLVFLYRSISLTYQKERAFAHDKAKAYCVVEAVLIDTRTGIVPFTSAVTKTYTAEKSKEDFSLAETVRKAELHAMGQALDEVADDLVKFLETVPSAAPGETEK